MSELPDSPESDHLSHSKPNAISSFQIPPEFQQVEFSSNDEQLYIEDVQGTKELWLIKIPHNFDAKNLKSKNVSLSGRQFLNENDEADASYELLASQNSLADKGLPNVFLPSRNGTKLMPAPPFSGQLSIMERMAVPSALLPPSLPKRSNELPPGLKQRFLPFGWEEPHKQHYEPIEPVDHPNLGMHKVKSKKKKSHKDKKSTAADNITTVDSQGDTQGDSERLSGAGDKESSGVTTKEHRKSKKRKQNLEIQKEDATSLNEDTLEDNNSLKKNKKKHKK